MGHQAKVKQQRRASAGAKAPAKPQPPEAPPADAERRALSEEQQARLKELWEKHDAALDAVAVAQHELEAERFRICKELGISPRQWLPALDKKAGSWVMAPVEQFQQQPGHGG